MISGITPQKIFKLCSIIWDIMTDKFYSAVNPPSKDDPVAAKYIRTPILYRPYVSRHTEEYKYAKYPEL